MEYIKEIIRDASELTNNYIAGSILGEGKIPHLESHSQVVLYVDFELGSLNNAQIKIEFSHDGVNYYQETVESINTSTGLIVENVSVHNFLTSGKYRLALSIMDKFIKVSAKGNGSTEGSSMAITAVVGK